MQVNCLCVCQAANANPQHTLLCSRVGSSKGYDYTNWYMASMCFPTSNWSEDQSVKSPTVWAGWEAGKPHKPFKAVNEKSQYTVISTQMVPLRPGTSRRWGEGEKGGWGEVKYFPQMGSNMDLRARRGLAWEVQDGGFPSITTSEIAVRDTS